ncbi:alpha/beta-Hydrolases superfamily protein [Prunus dulcis]|uniref:Alpha/beta-Hydrolases superfamily protein n=1 Tax=Prunus dulcis TaxID=3755 RepID=A0A4Y1S2Z0_PRUDU|nr:alpha/beta-Hydrolases superfamily protein [Prunus dulcis]
MHSKKQRNQGAERERESTEMEKIEHTTVSTNGINMHIASIGTGPVVLFLHGFPELWYSWRHQLLSLSSLGYRCIAPDLRGFGDTDAPPSPASYSALHIVGDLIGLLDHLGIDQVFLVGHDWGAVIAWWFCLFRPDRVKALVNLSVAFSPRNPKRKPVDGFRALFGDDYYICRFQEPGEIEKEFAGYDTASIMKKTWEITGPWTGLQIKVPVKFIVGDLDITYHIPGVKNYIHNGGFKRDVPFLQEVVVIEDGAHFINQERPDEISQHVYDFIQKF